jgi:PIN like domain
VRLFVDEDAGPTFARSLIATGLFDVDYVSNDRSIKTGTEDEKWIPYAGQRGFLVISHNKRMLRVQAQRALLVVERVGIVFVPNQATVPELTDLTLAKRRWMEGIDASIERPFAYVVHRDGQTAVRALVLSR